MSLEYEQGPDDLAHGTPMAGGALIFAGITQALAGFAHGMLYSLGFGIAMLDPELGRGDPNVLMAVGGMMLCFLFPDVLSLGIGVLAALLGYQARRKGASPITLGAAVTCILWTLCRMGLDVMSCQCSTLFVWTIPLASALVAVMFISRDE